MSILAHAICVAHLGAATGRACGEWEIPILRELRRGMTDSNAPAAFFPAPRSTCAFRGYFQGRRWPSGFSFVGGLIGRARPIIAGAWAKPKDKAEADWGDEKPFF